MTDKLLGWVVTYAVPVLALFLVVLGIESDRLSSVVVGMGVLIVFSIREAANKIVAAIREQRPRA